MDKHLTEIELFEYSNHLIGDDNQLNKITQHLLGCEDCKTKLALEKIIDSSLKNSLVVEHKVELNQHIVNYFTQEKPTIIGIDTKGIIYLLLVLSGLLLINQLTAIKSDYLTVIVTATMGLLFIESFFKYKKLKKQQVTS
ncbi:MAG: hypothetical protein AB7O47_03195 [Flavobacteriales bacterium]